MGISDDGPIDFRNHRRRVFAKTVCDVFHIEGLFEFFLLAVDDDFHGLIVFVFAGYFKRILKYFSSKCK